MKITNEAVEAAAAKMPAICSATHAHRASLALALEAAAPALMAQAWEDGEAAGQDNADSNRGYDIEHKYNPYRSQG